MPDNWFKVLETIRMGHWNWTKGALQSILDSFWPEPPDYDSNVKWTALKPIFDKFIKEVDEILE